MDIEEITFYGGLVLFFIICCIVGVSAEIEDEKKYNCKYTSLGDLHYDYYEYADRCEEKEGGLFCYIDGRVQQVESYTCKKN